GRAARGSGVRGRRQLRRGERAGGGDPQARRRRSDPHRPPGQRLGQRQVPAALAELLGVSGAVPVQKVEVRDGELYVERVTEDGYQPITMPMPSVLGISNEINQPRYPTLKGIM